MKKKWIWTLAVILYVGFIFHNSLTPADESSRQSGKVLEIILRVVEWLGGDSGWITEHLIRKTAHFTEYTVLGILLGETLRQYQTGVAMQRILQCWIGSVIPLVDETLQLFTEGRSGQISDVWLDMAGVFTGFFLIGMIFWMKKMRTVRE